MPKIIFELSKEEVAGKLAQSLANTHSFIMSKTVFNIQWNEDHSATVTITDKSSIGSGLNYPDFDDLKFSSGI